MPLVPILKKYLIDLENTNKTPKQFVHRTQQVVNEINSATLDEAKEALDFLAAFKKDLPTSQRTIALDYRILGKNMLVGGSIGLGIGFFAGVTLGGSMLGALVGLEKAGLSIYCRRQRLAELADRLSEQISHKMEGLLDKTCQLAS